MYTGTPPLEQRIGAGLLTGLVVGLIGALLLASLASARKGKAVDALTVVTIVALAPPPPEPAVPQRKPSRRPEGAAAPPNVRSTPVAVVAPQMRILLPPPPVVTATVAATGPDASAGAAPLPGPGQGAGGIGNGRGSGGSGDGTGGGPMPETPPHRVRGRLNFSDAAKVADGESLVGREMTTEFLVGADGRVSGCRATHSSGLPAVDAEICRLIEKRFRYEPARDITGRPVRSGIVMDHGWDEEY